MSFFNPMECVYSEKMSAEKVTEVVTKALQNMLILR